MTDGSTTAGQIIVKFIADTAGFEAGYNKVDSSLVKFGQESADATSQAKDLQRQTENAGKAAKATAKETEELADSMDKQSDAASDAASATEEAGDEIERTGEKARSAKGDIFGLNEVANKLKSSLGVMALGGALITAAKAMIDLQDKAVKTQRGFQILYGDIDKATDALYRYRDAERSLVGGDEESRAQTYEAVSREFKSIADTGYGRELQQQLISNQDVYGIGGAQAAYSLGEIMSKWGINEDKALETLNLITEVSKNQQGSVSENINENLSALAQYDQMLLSMGMSFEDALRYFQSLDSAENRKGVLESMGAIEREWTAGMSERAAAEEQIPIISKAIIEAQRELSESGDEGGAISRKIEELREELTNYQQILKMTDGDLLKSVLTGGTYSGVTGRNKMEVLELGQIYQSLGTVQLPAVTNEAYEVEKSWNEKIGTMWANYMDVGGDLLSGAVNEELENVITAAKDRIGAEFETNGIIGAANALAAIGVVNNLAYVSEIATGTGNTRNMLNSLTTVYSQQPLQVPQPIVINAEDLYDKQPLQVPQPIVINAEDIPGRQAQITVEYELDQSQLTPLYLGTSSIFGEGPSEEVTDAYSKFTETVSDTAGVFENMETTSKNVNDNIQDEEGICYNTAIQMQTLADATNNAAEAQERFNRAMEGATSNAGYSVSTSIVSASRGGAGT